MDILEKLPHDLQEHVYKCLKQLKVLRNKPRQVQLSFDHCLVCSAQKFSEVEHKYIDGEDYDNKFSFTTTITCDRHDMVWVTHEVKWSQWNGWVYNLVDIPLMVLDSEKDIKKLIKLMKATHAECIKYNHKTGGKSFKNQKSSWFEMNDVKYKKLSSNLLKAYIKKMWFSDELAFALLPERHKDQDQTSIEYEYGQPSETEDEIDEPYQRRYRFRVEDACPDIGSSDICMPYIHADLQKVQKEMPVTYKCLEDNGKLWSPYFKLSAPIIKYSKHWLALNEAIDKKDFTNILPPDQFNQLVTGILTDELNLNCLCDTICLNTGYMGMPDIGTILRCIEFRRKYS